MEKGQGIWTIEQVKSIATKDNSLSLSDYLISKVMKEHFNMSFRKIQRTPI
jgi:hypothetical protein